jgi:radical SAM superfamily enzyme YgiQ (UPF0313 family)
VLNYIDDFQPHLVVVNTSTPSIYNDIDVAEAIKLCVPDTFILLVGPHVSALPEDSLQLSSAVDGVARKEYDYTVRDLVLALGGANGLQDVLGLSYRDKSGTIVHNPDRPFIKDLDALPFVSQIYKRHLDVENYFYSITRYPEVAIVTGRGCPYRCNYCVWPQTLTGHTYRRRSVADIADEFEFIAQELPQIKEVFIEDDTLTVDEARAVALAKELIKRGNKLSFTANSRPDVSYETLRWLKKAGLRLLCVGFESGDQKVLDAMHKGTKVKQFYAFREAARRAGVLVHGCFMAGNPQETRETLEATLDVAKRLEPDTAQFFPLMVYPGTQAYEWAKHNGYITAENFEEWLTPDGLHRSTIDLPHLSSEEIVEWCDDARRSFYLRPRYFLSKARQVIAHPSEARRIFRAARVFIKYLFRSSLSNTELDEEKQTSAPASTAQLSSKRSHQHDSTNPT